MTLLALLASSSPLSELAPSASHLDAPVRAIEADMVPEYSAEDEAEPSAEEYEAMSMDEKEDMEKEMAEEKAMEFEGVVVRAGVRQFDPLVVGEMPIMEPPMLGEPPMMDETPMTSETPMMDEAAMASAEDDEPDASVEYADYDAAPTGDPEALTGAWTAVQSAENARIQEEQAVAAEEDAEQTKRKDSEESEQAEAVAKGEAQA